MRLRPPERYKNRAVTGSEPVRAFIRPSFTHASWRHRRSLIVHNFLRIFTPNWHRHCSVQVCFVPGWSR